MLSFEDAGRVLDEAVERLPEGIFDDLNGGVNLLPEESWGRTGAISWACTTTTLWGGMSRYSTVRF